MLWSKFKPSTSCFYKKKKKLSQIIFKIFTLFSEVLKVFGRAGFETQNFETKTRRDFVVARLRRDTRLYTVQLLKFEYYVQKKARPPRIYFPLYKPLIRSKIDPKNFPKLQYRLSLITSPSFVLPMPIIRVKRWNIPHDYHYFAFTNKFVKILLRS